MAVVGQRYIKATTAVLWKIYVASPEAVGRRRRRMKGIIY